MAQNHTIYEKFTKVYELFWRPFFKNSFKKVCHEINELPGENVLEVGVGPGETLVHYDKVKKVIGIDISSKMIQESQKKIHSLGLSHCEVFQVEPGEFPFDDISKDIIVSFSVVTVVPNPKEFLQSLARLVKPGGYLLIIGHIADEDESLLSRALDRALNPLSNFFMGFTLLLKSDVFEDLSDFKLIKKFASATAGPIVYNKCYIFQKSK